MIHNIQNVFLPYMDIGSICSTSEGPDGRPDREQEGPGESDKTGRPGMTGHDCLKRLDFNKCL